MKYKIFLFLFGCLGMACQEKSARIVQPAFYYWKSSFRLEETTLQQLQALQVKRLYVKFFDVTWDKHQQLPKPVAALQFLTPFPTQFELVPTVFITNQTFKEMADSSLQRLSKQLADKIIRITTKSTYAFEKIPEIQIDCDWTQQTQQKYFQFLTHLQKQFPTQPISATIRLHQVKFAAKTGIPPVKKGLLMNYNMDNLKAFDTPNSILSIPLTKTYLQPHLKKYPLPVDVALPIFSWGLIFRQNRFRKIINNLQKSALQTQEAFKNIGNNQYQALENTTFKGYGFLKNDVIRVEESDLKTVQKAAQIISQQLSEDTIYVALYHLDTTLLKQYSTEELASIFGCLGQFSP